MSYKPNQSFNDWNIMLGDIYDKTQNYSKSVYEIHCHLTEVTGGFGKHFIKKRDYKKSEEFLTSIFAWALALIRKVVVNQRNPVEVDKIIFKKFPGVCPYCLSTPCSCETKGELNYKKLKEITERFLELQKDREEKASIKEIQKMLGNIYGKTWNRYNQVNKKETRINLKSNEEIAYYNISFLYSRMTEELAEIAESIRFYHLYKSNFENEIADFFAWYFAIVSIFHELYDNPEDHRIDLEKILWAEFPGICNFCNMPKCVCRPGPVRDLLSKPSIDEYENYDETTQTENKNKLKEHLDRIKGIGKINETIFPISTITISITNYSRVKSKKEEFANFLRDISSILRKKIRYDKDKFYRKDADELFILCQDTIDKEVTGLKERIDKLIAERKIKETYKSIKFKIETNTLNSLNELQNQIE